MSHHPALINTVEGIKEYHLSNGLQVLLIPDQSQSNFIVNIVYKVGSRHEGYGEKGMAHLLEHMLFKSTKNLGDIKKLLSEKGGQANGTTWYDRTNYFEILPASDENLEWCIQMEADRMVNATILQSDLDVEFSVVRNEFEIGENSPNRMLNERILSTAYMWHNYGNSTIGSREDIERVKADRLRLFYEKYYQPDNAVLIIGGKFDEEKALKYIEKYFSAIPAPTREIEPTYTVEPAQDGEKYVELKKSGDIQMVAAAYHTAAYADEDFAAIDALNEILTAEPSGYIYKALVDEDKATEVYGWQPTLRDPGFLYLHVTVPKNKSLSEARKTFVSELDRIPEMKFSERDLKRAQSRLLKNFNDIQNNTLRLVIGLTEAIGAGDYRLAFIYRDAVEALSIEDIHRVAKKYFIPSNRTLGVFIPENNVLKIQPKEIKDEDIIALTQKFKGREEDESLIEFESTIPNIKSNLSVIRTSEGTRIGRLNKSLKGKKVLATFRFPIGTSEFLTGKSESQSIMASLLKSGTSSKTREDIHDLLDQLKSRISFSFHGQTFAINVSSYETEFEAAMDLVRELITDSTFPENEIHKMIKEQKAKIEASQNDPQSIVFDRIQRLVNHYPKGHIFYTPLPEERIEELDQVTKSDIEELFHHLGASIHSYGTVISGIDEARMQTIAEATFKDWNAASEYKKTYPTFFETEPITRKINTPDKDNGAVLARVNLNVDRYHADYPALVMADALLGSGGFLTSRIPMRLREKEGISYGAGSFLRVAYAHDAAHWNIYAFYNSSLQGLVDSAIRDELEKIHANGFTLDEMEANKKSWSTDRKTVLGNDNFLATTLINNYLHLGVELEEFEKLESHIQDLTLDEVNRVFKKYFDLDKLTFLYAGDFEKKEN